VGTSLKTIERARLIGRAACGTFSAPPAEKVELVRTSGDGFVVDQPAARG